MITTLDVKPDLANAQNAAAGASKFCPGCGHGMILKTLAKTIDELELKERAVLLLFWGAILDHILECRNEYQPFHS